MTHQYTSALVVVDLQNDFLAQGGYYDEITRLTRTKGGDLSQADIDTLAQLYRHPPPSCVVRDGYQDLVTTVAEVAAAALARQMPTIFVRTAYDPESCYRPPLFIAAPERKDYACHPGTWGSELVDPIKRLASDRCAKVVEKHTYDAFFETELRGFLRFHHIDTLYVAGVETNVCVLCTALSALTNGFGTVILEDCVATSLPALHAPSLRIIEVAKGQRMCRQEFLALLESGRSPNPVE
jgi:nicotinamidase-related amidase